jgi:hypothetical protein
MPSSITLCRRSAWQLSAILRIEQLLIKIATSRFCREVLVRL